VHSETSGEGTSLLGDVGSTFIKLVAIDPAGRVQGRYKRPTTHDDLAAGVSDAQATLTGADRPEFSGTLSSSAGGGLRVIVLGFERELTVKAALRATATAGARIVGIYTPDEFEAETEERLGTRGPDLALLTGGTDGGDGDGILRNARRLKEIAPGLPVVVAGNQQAYAAVRVTLGNGKPVAFVRNVMPRIGELDPGEAQSAIREIFVTHVMGHGRYASAAAIADAIALPTPAAVLAGAEAIAAAGSENPLLARPVVVDVGGATTDIHSVIPIDDTHRGGAAPGVPDQVVTRTVEGDLGLRENAEALVAVAAREGYLTDEEMESLGRDAVLRTADRRFVPKTADQTRVDERLAELATAIALHRHAGVMRVSLTPGGAVLRRTGRDLRDATCLVVTGGVFEHSRDPAGIARRALDSAIVQGALIRADLPIFRDREYLLWAVGLLAHTERTGARALVEATLERVGA
jgi:uncharacterized protein (TIGR01319 family)